MVGATAPLDTAWYAHLGSWIDETTNPEHAPVFIALDRVAYQRRSLSDEDIVDLHSSILTTSPLRIIASPNVALQLRRARDRWPATLQRALDDERLWLCDDDLNSEDKAGLRRRCVAAAIGQLQATELATLWTENKRPTLSAAHISGSPSRTWFEGRTIFVGEDSSLDRDTANWLAAISRVPGIHSLGTGLTWLFALLLSVITLISTRASSTIRAIIFFLALAALTTCLAVTNFYLFAQVMPMGLLGTALLTSAAVGGLLERYRIEQRLHILARPTATLAESSAESEAPSEDLKKFLTGMLEQLRLPVSATILLTRHTDGKLDHVVTTGEPMLPAKAILSAVADAELTSPKWWNGLAPKTLFRCYIIPLNTAFHRQGYWILCVSPSQMSEVNQKLFVALGRIVCARVR
ncbi:MAG TPA: hypothetical protein ENK31_03945, partial [Nannocystis exedens]|nr:hypothetical protein [Nannocystis exedens]